VSIFAIRKEEAMESDGGVKRLYKSRSDRMIDGICGGLSEYFGLDSTLVRIVMVLLVLCGGLGLILYLAGMILMPTAPLAAQPSVPGSPKSSPNNHRFWGILLVGVGIIWFMGNMGWSFWHHWWWFSWGTVIPVLLILAGVTFLFGGRNYLSGTISPAGAGAAGSTQSAPPAGIRRLYRSRWEKKLFGVCGGLGQYFNVDPVLIRVLFVMAAFVSFGFVLLMYIVMAIVVPTGPAATPAH
jgi:phage shock protein C